MLDSVYESASGFVNISIFAGMSPYHSRDAIITLSQRLPTFFVLSDNESAASVDACTGEKVSLDSGGL